VIYLWTDLWYNNNTMAEKFKILSAGGSSKGLNIFKSSAYKEHEAAPMSQIFWVFRWNAIVWLSCAVAFTFAFVLEHIFRYGWSPATAHWSAIFLRDAITSVGMSVVAAVPGWIARCVMRPDFYCIMPLLPFIAFYFMVDDTLTKEFNPHGKDIYDEKSSRKATAADIKKMGLFNNKEGLFNGFMMVLGYFKDKGKTKPLMMDETLSALCVAPPGTGKTAGVVIPTIVECDNVSMIINDPKPELDYKTSAYRATIGPVFIMNWAGQDDPERGIYYPSWNPLSPEHVPFEIEQRDLYVDTDDNLWVCTYNSGVARIDKTVKFTNSDDGLFSNKARSILELDDHKIIVSGKGGLSIFNRDGVLYSKKPMLYNYVPVLCTEKWENGLIFAGTDGDGIVVIKNFEVIKVLTKNDGLVSNTILRMHRSSDGKHLIVSTSDGLCVVNEDLSCYEVTNFPYHNTFDIINVGLGRLFITTSNGVYVVAESDLLEDRRNLYTEHLDESYGFNDLLTSLSRNYLDNELLYLASNAGVYIINTRDYGYPHIEYKLRVSNFNVDGLEYTTR